MSRRFQFSLKALMVAVAVAAVCCSIWTWLPAAVKAAVVVAAAVAFPLAAIQAAWQWIASLPDQNPNPQLITAEMLAALGDVPMSTMHKLIVGGTLKPLKRHPRVGPLFDPEAPDVVAWLKAVRGKWPLD